MPKSSEIVTCIDCQEMFQRKFLNRMRRCPDCALKALVGNIRQLSAHSGPCYEKWKKAVQAAARRL